MNHISRSTNNEGRNQKGLAILRERLRASKRETESAEQADGLDAGRTWATEYAEYKHLCDLAAWWDTTSEHDIDVILTTLESDVFGASHRLVCIILGNESADRHDSEEFWDTAIGEDDNRQCSDVFVRGFAEGALEVWNSVKDEL